ncbi:hypothetical protein RCL1_000921 [Eukaryota sp. TZLM3-RCL]
MKPYGFLLLFFLVVVQSTFQPNTELASCLCDLTSQCDPFCCCDPDCTSQEISSFNYVCLPETFPFPSVEICPKDTSVSSINFETTKSSSFCVKRINSELAGYFYSLPSSLPPSDASDFLASVHSPVQWPSISDQFGPQAGTSYKTGSILWTSLGFSSIFSSSSSSSCTFSPIKFRQNSQDQCQISLTSEDSCSLLSSSLLDLGLNFLSTPVGSAAPITRSVYFQDPVTSDLTELVGLESSFVDGNLCKFSTISVTINIKLNQNSIENFEVIYVLTDISMNSVVNINTRVLFGTSENLFENFYYGYKGGNPGYQEGRFILTGTTLDDVISRDHDTFLSIPSSDQCSASSPIKFLHDTESSCTVSVPTTTPDCSSIRSTAFEILSQNFGANYRVAMFGNASVDGVTDWISINSINFLNENLQETTGYCRDVPRAVEYEIVYSKGGSLQNPQNFIIHIRRKLIKNDWFYSRCFDPMTCSSFRQLTLSTRVKFIDYSSEPSSYVPPLPPLLPKFPSDLFHPFYKEHGNYDVTVGLLVVLIVVLLVTLL